jgi:hypothetical protein
MLGTSSQFEALDILLQPARAKPLFLAKYNFSSLLRALSHLKPFNENVRDLLKLVLKASYGQVL